MTTNSIVPPLTEQVRQALDQYLAAHDDAERKIAAAATLKMAVGGNAEDRKRQAASMSEKEYEGYSISYASAEIQRQKAVAHLERSEKELNVLRELLQREAADVHMQAAERYHQAVTIADTTAMRYQAMPANHTSTAEYRSRYAPEAGNGIKRATVAADDDENLPF